MHAFLLPVILICFDPKSPIPEQSAKAVKFAVIEQEGLKVQSGLPPEPRISCKDPELDKYAKLVAIQYRGNFSRWLPKKPFLLDFDLKKVLDITPDNDKKTPQALLGMNPSNKWVLYGPLNDRSLLRNDIAYDLANQMGLDRKQTFFAPQSKPVELFINDKYWGLYNLTEKIERGKNKVDLPKFDEETSQDIIGKFSYLLKISSGNSDFQTHRKTNISYEYPSRKKLAELKKSNPKLHRYITKTISQELDALEERIKPKYFDDPHFSYRKMIDMDSFVDYFLMQEITKNDDGFRRSFYFYKTTDGIFHAGPVWDFDIAMGNINIHNMQSHTGWLHQTKHLFLLDTFWISKIAKDQVFKTKVQERYALLRKPGAPLHKDNIEKMIEAHLQQIHGAGLRDEERWERAFFFMGTVGRWILNTNKKHESFEQNVTILKEWLIKRLVWLDLNIYGL